MPMMVKPILRGIDTYQIDDIEDDGAGGFAPRDRNNYVLMITASIGPDERPRVPNGELGADIFRFGVCSPYWLSTDYTDDPWLRAMLMLPRWDYGALVSSIEALCRGIEGRTWTEVGLKLSRYMDWEFLEPVIAEVGAH